MGKLPKKLIHEFEGEKFEFKIQQRSILVNIPLEINSQISKDLKSFNSPVNITNLKNYNISHIQEIGTYKNNKSFKLTFNKPLSQKTINKFTVNSDIQNSSWIYTFGGREYYGQASLILLTKYPIELNKIKALVKKDGYVVKELRIVGERYYLIQYNGDLEANNRYNHIRNNKPEWLLSVEQNLYSYDVNITKTSPIEISINPTDTPEVSNQWAFEKVNAYKAIELQKGSKEIKVAIFDTGIDNGHPDLFSISANNIGYDYVTNTIETFPIPDTANSHGTKCAGVIGASKKYSKGIDGIAKGVTIIDYRIGYIVNSQKFRVDLFDIITAFYQAAFKDKVDIINCSWGFDIGFETLKYMINKVWNEGREGKGTIIVCAAGNQNKNVNKKKKITFPANMENIITVSAIDSDLHPVKKKKFGWGSNFGENVDIAAPGIDLVTTSIRKVFDNNKTFGYTTNFDGTSAAAPIVSGCIALMISKDNQLKSKEIKSIITDKENLIQFQTTPKKNYGAGIIDIETILKKIT